MTIEQESRTDELFGLAGSLPRPGWVILDAARDQRFTGELAFDVSPQARVFLDRGHIYLAERVTEPSLGSRLVDSGALTAVQLEHGSVTIAGVEHLGRLFERVPSIDRHAVSITAEMMTDECVGWLASLPVLDAVATPYRHHPAGIHRWDQLVEAPDVADEIPAGSVPTADVGASARSPETAPPLWDDDQDFDDMIQWEESSWLDGTPPITTDPANASPSTDDGLPAADEQFEPSSPVAGDVSANWADRLEDDELPVRGSDPLATAPAEMSDLPVEPTDRFEVIWPSGDVDEDFGGAGRTDVPADPDFDRAGPTARVTRTGDTISTNGASLESDVGPASTDSAVVDSPKGSSDGSLDHSSDDEPATDEVVLAMRRAVASIETGSLAARRRIAGVPSEDDSSRGVDLVLPGRVAVRAEPNERAPGIAPVTRSVFDEPSAPPVPMPAPSVHAEPLSYTAPAPAPAPVSRRVGERTGALRRLIGSLRRA